MSLVEAATPLRAAVAAGFGGLGARAEFVVVWSWVNEWLGPLENAASGNGHSLLHNRGDKKTIRIDRLPAARLGFVGQSHATELEIAIAVAELLRSLDNHLGEGSTNSLSTRSFPDLSGKRHVVLRTNDFPPARDARKFFVDVGACTRSTRPYRWWLSLCRPGRSRSCNLLPSNGARRK